MLNRFAEPEITIARQLTHASTRVETAQRLVVSDRGEGLLAVRMGPGSCIFGLGTSVMNHREARGTAATPNLGGVVAAHTVVNCVVTKAGSLRLGDGLLLHGGGMF